jgi:urease accessory protein
VAAFAHPGTHIEGLSAGFTHPFTGLDHLIAMVVVGVWAAFLGGRALWAVPASFVALLGVGAALGAHGATLPGVEHMIAASVFALGLLVAFQTRVATGWAMALVGGFALFHGFAHGAEIPAAAHGAVFGLGFIASTIVLHVAGIGLGMLAANPRLQRWLGAATAATGLALGLTQ